MNSQRHLTYPPRRHTTRFQPLFTFRPVRSASGR